MLLTLHAVLLSLQHVTVLGIGQQIRHLHRADLQQMLARVVDARNTSVPERYSGYYDYKLHYVHVEQS